MTSTRLPLESLTGDCPGNVHGGLVLKTLRESDGLSVAGVSAKTGHAMTMVESIEGTTRLSFRVLVRVLYALGWRVVFERIE